MLAFADNRSPLAVRGRGRLGFEVKRTTAPAMTPSMRSALNDLGLDSLTVIHAGEHSFALAKNVRALSWRAIIREIGSIKHRQHDARHQRCGEELGQRLLGDDGVDLPRHQREFRPAHFSQYPPPTLGDSDAHETGFDFNAGDWAHGDALHKLKSHRRLNDDYRTRLGGVRALDGDINNVAALEIHSGR